MIIDNRYYRIKSIFGYRLRALMPSLSRDIYGHYIDIDKENFGNYLMTRMILDLVFAT